MDKCQLDELHELREEHKSLHQYRSEMADEGRYAMFDQDFQERRGRVSFRMQEIERRVEQITGPQSGKGA